MCTQVRALTFSAIGIVFSISAHGAEEWTVGFGKIDVTPQVSRVPLRLSGYSSRNDPAVEIADSLHVRAMVMTPIGNRDSTESTTAPPITNPDTLVLVSMDSILASSEFTVRLSAWLNEQHGLARSQLAVSSTHSHAAPQQSSGLDNLLAKPLTEEERTAAKDYTERLFTAATQAIDKALVSRQPAKLATGASRATFAVNRRVLKDGTWVGFGETKEAAKDHRVRVLGAWNTKGALIGAAYMYACHCTTLGGDFNRISGDWAGLSATRLEAINRDAIFLPVIGCGADANPSPRGAYDHAVQHASQIVDAVMAATRSPAKTTLPSTSTAHFGYAGISADRPTDEHIEALLSHKNATERAWAKHMQQTKKEMGRLPESYPMPIHTWQFGDELTWVFLGGEVVVDYQFQIEKELPTKDTWVAAYTDDVFAYVASEAMRSQGGYEVDKSMIFYLQPGRWQTGTQSLILRRVKEIFDGVQLEQGPLSPSEGLDAIRVPNGYDVRLVAHEPLVADPINIAFSPDGTVWVVEMSDYPLGSDGGGRVKQLVDRNADGVLDDVRLSIQELNYPTSVFPWKDGAIVITAPEIIFVADRDGDGKAEVRDTLLSGFHEANPQHRASGFEIGLDGWLHFGAGDGTKEIFSYLNNQTYHVHGHDLKWNPVTGEIQTVAGETQFVRARDEFGNWFGNSNSRPIYHYVVDTKYIDGARLSSGNRQDLLTPAVAPPVLPRSLTKERFNDLYAFNRFTSACSSTIARVADFKESTRLVGFICEPVHNLVARIQIHQQGVSYVAERHTQDKEFDFFTSQDPWSRPVRVTNAPDGSIWIVDMLRKVIEHPEWIPTAWQEGINLRDGSGQGRIYRVSKSSGSATKALPRVEATSESILNSIQDSDGAIRDLALLQLLWTNALDLKVPLHEILQSHERPEIRAAALGAMLSKDWIDAEVLSSLFERESDPRVLVVALRAAENFDADIENSLASVPARNLGPQVDLQWLLTVSRRADMNLGIQLRELIARLQVKPIVENAWIFDSLVLLENPNAAEVAVTSMLKLSNSQQLDVNEFFKTVHICKQLWNKIPAESKNRILQDYSDVGLPGNDSIQNSTLILLSMNTDSSSTPKAAKILAQARETAKSQLVGQDTPTELRERLINLVGPGIGRDASLSALSTLLSGSVFGRFPPGLQSKVIENARNVDSEEVPKLLLSSWGQYRSSQKKACCSTLLSNRRWVPLLVEALENGAVKPNDLDPATIQTLRGYRDRSLRTRCLAVFGKPTVRTEVVSKYLAALPSPKEYEKGAALHKEHCAVCHSPDKGALAIGPPLENLKHWTIEQWVTSIMDPNRNVEPKYLQSNVLTEDDQVLSGILIEESSQNVRIAQSDGKLRDIARSNIQEIRSSGKSLMPEGFEEKLTPEQLSQLLAFLRQK